MGSALLINTSTTVGYFDPVYSCRQRQIKNNRMRLKTKNIPLSGLEDTPEYCRVGA